MRSRLIIAVLDQLINENRRKYAADELEDAYRRTSWPFKQLSVITAVSLSVFRKGPRCLCKIVHHSQVINARHRGTLSSRLPPVSSTGIIKVRWLTRLRPEVVLTK